MSVTMIEIVVHFAAIPVALGVIYHNFASQHRIRRNFRTSRILFWGILAASLFFLFFNVVHLVNLVIPGTFSHFFPLVDLLSEYPTFLIQSVLIAYLLANKIVAEKAHRPKRILAIGAHPDDLEIAVGATLAKLHDNGHLIYGLVLSCGEQGGNELQRPREALKGAEFLGMEMVKQMNFDDTHFMENPVNLVNTIEAIIKEVNPDIILTHSHNDIHQDHQAVYEATLRAGRRQTTILCYESPSVTQQFVPTFFVNVEDYAAVKILAIQIHKDQLSKPYMAEEQILGKLAFRGGQARMAYAEGFEIARMASNDLGDF